MTETEREEHRQAMHRMNRALDKQSLQSIPRTIKSLWIQGCATDETRAIAERFARRLQELAKEMEGELEAL